MYDERETVWILEELEETKYFRLDLEGPCLVLLTTRFSRSSSSMRQRYGIDHIVRLNQVHSDKVFHVTDQRSLRGDGMFTTKENLFLQVVTADCLPIFIWSNDFRVAAICHSGWRGTLMEIGRKTAEAIAAQTGKEKEDLSFAFGPCIGPCCYEVGEGVVNAFRKKFVSWNSLFVWRKGKVFLDLKKASREPLLDCGLREAGSLDLCTSCSTELFFSARRDRTEERNRAVIGLTSLTI